ncbi:MAG: hypothetical protein ACREJ3_14315 [Polyangiaceae bacterium]
MAQMQYSTFLRLRFRQHDKSRHAATKRGYEHSLAESMAMSARALN